MTARGGRRRPALRAVQARRRAARGDRPARGGHPSAVSLPVLRTTVEHMRKLEFRLSEMRAELAAEPDLSGYDVAIPNSALAAVGDHRCARSARRQWLRPWWAWSSAMAATGSWPAARCSLVAGGLPVRRCRKRAARPTSAPERAARGRDRAPPGRPHGPRRARPPGRAGARRGALVARPDGPRRGRRRRSRPRPSTSPDRLAPRRVPRADGRRPDRRGRGRAARQGRGGRRRGRHTLAGMGEIGARAGALPAAFQLRGPAARRPSARPLCTTEAQAEARVNANEIDAEKVAADGGGAGRRRGDAGHGRAAAAHLRGRPRDAQRGRARHDEEGGALPRAAHGARHRAHHRRALSPAAGRRGDAHVHASTRPSSTTGSTCGGCPRARSTSSICARAWASSARSRQPASPPLVLDDPFVTFDDERADARPGAAQGHRARPPGDPASRPPTGTTRWPTTSSCCPRQPSATSPSRSPRRHGRADVDVVEHDAAGGAAPAATPAAAAARSPNGNGRGKPHAGRAGRGRCQELDARPPHPSRRLSGRRSADRRRPDLRAALRDQLGAPAISAGGLLSRRSSVLLAILVSQVIGLFGAAALVLFSGESQPSTESIPWAIAAGISGVVGLGAFYYALSRGTMGVIAPLAALIGAGVPVSSRSPAARHRRRRALACGLALVAVVLTSLPGGETTDSERRQVRVELHELPLIVVSGLGFAGFFLFVDQATTAGASWWPLFVVRSAGVAVVLGTFLVPCPSCAAHARSRCGYRAGPRSGPTPRGAPAGRATDRAAAAYRIGRHGRQRLLPARQGNRCAVGRCRALVALPGRTTILAAIFLHERLRRTQIAGVALATVSVPLMR